MKRVLEVDASFYDQCTSLCLSLQLLSQQWGIAVASASFTSAQCRQYSTTVSSAVALLTQALDGGHFRFTSFLPHEVRDEKSDDTIPRVEAAIFKKEQQLIETLQHDTIEILHGRLLLCLLLGQHHRNQLFKAGSNVANFNEFFLVQEHAVKYLQFNVKLLRHFCEMEIGEDEAYVEGNLDGRDDFEPEQLEPIHPGWWLLRSVTTKVYFLRHLLGKLGTEKLVPSFLKEVLELVISFDTSVLPVVRIQMLLDLCMPMLSVVLGTWHDKAQLPNLKAFFSRLIEFSDLFNTIEFEASLVAFFKHLHTESEKFFTAAVDHFLECDEIVPSLVRRMKNGSEYALRLCDLCMTQAQWPFVMNADFFFSLINLDLVQQSPEMTWHYRIGNGEQTKQFFVSFGRREFESVGGLGKRSPLVSCYQSGDHPGVYAIMAILISESHAITFFQYEEKERSGDKWVYELRFAKHFRKLLGEDIELILGRKLRTHVRRLCTRILTEVDKVQEKYLDLLERNDRKRYAHREQFGNDLVMDLEEEHLDPQDEDYVWLLHQMRVFLLSYSHLDWFIQKQHRPPVPSNARGVAEVEPVAWPLKLNLGLPRWGDEPIFNGYKNLFSDLTIEIYQDDHGEVPPAQHSSPDPNGEDEKPHLLMEKEPVLIVNAHKIVVSLHSKYLHMMLTSKMREGNENTIRLTSNYPFSLQKLILSFYEHVLEIGSASELIEMLYLADEYDVPAVRMMLLRALTPKFNAVVSNGHASALHEPCNLEFNFDNARIFLSCSAKIGLKLESKIFSGLAQEWWRFPGEDRGYNDHRRLCSILLESLGFPE